MGKHSKERQEVKDPQYVPPVGFENHKVLVLPVGCSMQENELSREVRLRPQGKGNKTSSCGVAQPDFEYAYQSGQSQKGGPARPVPAPAHLASLASDTRKSSVQRSSLHSSCQLAPENKVDACLVPPSININMHLQSEFASKFLQEQQRRSKSPLSSGQQ